MFNTLTKHLQFTREFYMDRIVQQNDYIHDTAMRTDLSRDRKLELINSAKGVRNNLITHMTNINKLMEADEL